MVSERVAFIEAISQFNQRQFYACHDTLEALWTEAMEPQRQFLQGVLQLAVAYYHLLNSNWRGAAILLGEGLSRLDYYCPEYCGIDVEALVNSSQANLECLQALGADGLDRFDCERIPQIGWRAPTA